MTLLDAIIVVFLSCIGIYMLASLLQIALSNSEQFDGGYGSGYIEEISNDELLNEIKNHQEWRMPTSNYNYLKFVTYTSDKTELFYPSGSSFQAASTIELEDKECEYCGCDNEPKAKRCSWCGAPLRRK